VFDAPDEITLGWLGKSIRKKNRYPDLKKWIITKKLAK
jgi:hypothetical protein